MIDREDMLRVGVIANTHGIRGEVKVFPTTDDVKRFKKLKQVYIDTEKELIEMQIVSVKYFKNLAILKFKDIDNINQIEKYKGRDLLITRDNAVPLEDDEYFIYDIIGAKVVEENGNEVGELKEVLTTGANDVYVVKTAEGKELLLPVIPDCVKEINVEEKNVIVHLMAGLTD